MKSKFDPRMHHRRSIRLKGYDYASEGAYFVTMVTQGREFLFGEIVDKEMTLNTYGGIVLRWWDEIPNHFPNVELGAFVIMPNHVHGIIFLFEERRGEVISPRNHPITDFRDAIVDKDAISPRGNPNNDVQNKIVGEFENPGGETSNSGVETPNPGGRTPENLGGRTPPLRKPTLGQVIAYFKYQSTKEMNRIETENTVTKFWQRNYYEHIIRDEKDLQQKSDYILDNPRRWEEDDENPAKSN